MLLARCRRSLLTAGDGRKERGQRGMVNASMAWSKPLHVGQNSLTRAEGL